MKIAGVPVEPPMKKAPHTCKEFAVPEHRKRVTHLDILKAIHRMLESTLPWHRKFRGDLKLISMHVMHAQQAGV